MIRIIDAEGVHIITRDEATGLEWSARDIGSFTNKAKNSAAEEACKALTLGGHSDWRLPAIEEFESTRHWGLYSFPPCWTSSWFWSSTPAPQSPDSWACLFDFCDSSSGIGCRSHDYRVRAVRGPVFAQGGQS